MKKRDTFKILAISLALSLCGCSDFLSENPKDNLYVEQIFDNETSAYVGLIGCYSAIIQGNYHNRNFQETLFPNSVFCVTGIDPLASGLGASNQDIIELFNFRPVPRTIAVYELFQGMYKAVSNINHFIHNIELTSFSEEVKARYIGEARFLRAKVYFDIIRIWGKCPLSLSVPESFEDDHKPMSGADAVFAAIESDLEYAYEHMPKKEEQKRGFPFNLAAKAYLAKVYAQMATSEQFFIGQTDPYTAEDRAEFWEKSYQAALTVYNAPQNNRYDLMPDYADLWRCHQQHTKESIFELSYNIPGSSNAWVQGVVPIAGVFTPLYNPKGKNNRTRPSVVMYEWHREAYNDGDPRLQEYVTGSYDYNELSGGGSKLVYPDEVLAKRESSNPYYERFPITLKYVDPNFISGNSVNSNLILYRYSDLLLVLAEAALETGRKSEVFDYVNQVLERARNSYGGASEEPKNWVAGDYVSEEDLRLAIMKERLYELSVEGHEWFDVRRRGVEWFRSMTTLYNTSLEKYRKPVDTNLAGQDRLVKVPNDLVNGIDMARRNLFLPVPQDELVDNINLTDADQNYGY
ncbi:MAG: RagB/SusD family nutrient uptake outer membrane protein [Bacteroidales bacterium]